MTVFEIVSGKRHLHHVQTSKEDVIDLDNRKSCTMNSESAMIEITVTFADLRTQNENFIEEAEYRNGARTEQKG